MDMNGQRPGLRPSSRRQYMPDEEEDAGLFFPEPENHRYRAYGQRREMEENYNDPLYADFNRTSSAPYQGNWRGRDEVDDYAFSTGAPPRRNRDREENSNAYRYEERPGSHVNYQYYSRDYEEIPPAPHDRRNNYRNPNRYSGNERYGDREEAHHDRRGPLTPPYHSLVRVPDTAVEQEEEKVEEGVDVNFVHHDSPFGPAISVYPKGYIRSQTKASPLARGGAGSSERQRCYENAEAAKIAAFERQSSHFGAPKRVSAPMIEICPGVFSRLRGAAETKECVKHDFFMPTLCFSCGLEQFCIQDASFVLCPTCRVINPLSGFDATPSRYKEDGGVGLGFTMEDLESLQMELIQDRRGAASNGYHL